MALCATLFKYIIVYLAISVLLETDFLKTILGNLTFSEFL